MSSIQQKDKCGTGKTSDAMLRSNKFLFREKIIVDEMGSRYGHVEGYYELSPDMASTHKCRSLAYSENYCQTFSQSLEGSANMA